MKQRKPPKRELEGTLECDLKCHLTPLIIGRIVLFARIELNNKGAIKELLNKMKEDKAKAKMYSSKWFEIVSDEVLENEREKIRQPYCTSGKNYSGRGDRKTVV